jgi:hypothetical protein
VVYSLNGVVKRDTVTCDSDSTSVVGRKHPDSVA